MSLSQQQEQWLEKTLRSSQRQQSGNSFIRTQAHLVNLDNSGTNPLDHVPRAARYPIQTSVSFREKGQERWQEATTVNISGTGILLQSGIDLLPKTLIEMQIILPHDIFLEPTAYVLCWGLVVRMDASFTEKCGQPVLAVAILRYRFSHD